MTRRSHNPYPVDSTYHPCCRAIGDHGRDCPELVVERLRSAVAQVNPASLTCADSLALIDLLEAAMKSDSNFGRACREREAARAKRVAEVDQ